MRYDVLKINTFRTVKTCGSNIYPDPEYHPARTLSFHDILYIYEGQWAVEQGEHTYLLKSGDVAFLRAMTYHSGPMLCTPNTRTMFLHFTRCAEDRYDVEISPEEVDHYLNSDFALIPLVTSCEESSKNVRRLIREIVDVFWSNRPDKERIINIVIQHLLCELAHIARSQKKTTVDWYVQIIDILRSSSKKMYSLQELADIAGISVRSLSARFKQLTGQSVYHYQLNVKLEMASAALRSSTMTVQEIASMYGFSDPYQFSRLFKQKYGVPPRTYRKNNPLTSRFFREVISDTLSDL